ncbi:MAG TPA: glycosyltransferase family 4 protein [Paludibacteraceae bacterium]|nr:glycosyltransferase family 4 protein [Paludibacteraceae bacterium]HOH74589.1 glycosyltransferase family 4 protein [Paludibacteraceae bacterium]
MKKNILVFLPTASIIVGGGEIAPLSQSQALSKNGHSVTILTVRTEEPTSYYQDFKRRNPQIKFVEVTSPIFGCSYANFINSHENIHLLYLSLYDWYKTITDNFDVCLIHYAPGMFCIPHIKRKILFLHGTPSEYSVYNDLAVTLTDNVIAVSNSIKNEWKNSLLNISKNKDIIVINNGIDLYPYENVKRVDNQIFFIGRLIDIKGLEVLIESIALLINTYPYIKLYIAGTGTIEYTNLLKNLVNKLDLNENIFFLGHISEEQKYKLYRESSFCVFPSFAKEGVLTTMLEASTQYCPTITTDSCGMVDFIIDEKYGLLAKPRDKVSLAEKIELFLTDSTLRLNCGNNAYNRAKTEFTWESNVDKLNKIFDEAS